MYFEEKDIELSIDGMGIVFYSPETTKNIPEGIDFFRNEFSNPDDVASHLKKGDVVGFCTGTGGDFLLKYREGYPDKNTLKEYPVCARLGIDIKDNKLCMVDLFWLMEWSSDCPEEQILGVEPGYYHITLCTKCPDSGTWGDNQIIYVYLNKLDEMPSLEDFPNSGIIQFFIEDAEPYGYEELCKVKYIEHYTRDESTLIKENPYKENYQECEPFKNNGKITFMQRQMPITSTCEKFEELMSENISDEERETLYDVCYACGSRVGGYPYFVQNAPAYYDNGDVDVLLLQLDIDDTCGIMFGDSGNCTFLINREQLKKRDFSGVEYDWQCC